MNYFAHALPLLESDDPYLLAGVAVPDWLGVVARRVKCRSKQALAHFDATDPRLASLARGVARHHHDDAWFHESPVFNQLQLAFAKGLRDRLGEGTSLRPWFLGHVLVELLIDASLVARDLKRLEDYFALLETASARRVQHAVETICQRPIEGLAEFVDRYRETRFLADYVDDERLTLRLNQVMRRVRLAELPPEFPRLLPAFRDAVDVNLEALLAPPVGIFPDATPTLAARCA